MAKISTSIIANQKFGTATPSCVAPMTPMSPARPRRDAANMPAGKAINVLSASAYSAKGNDTHMRAAIMSVTGVRYV